MATPAMRLPAAPATEARLDGTVVTASGQPAVGALVAATREPLERDAAGIVVRHVAHADDAGRFSLPGLPPGTYGATATTAASGAGHAGPLALAGPLATAPILLRLDPPARHVEGTVRAPDGEAVAGAVIVFIAQDERPGARFIVEADAAAWRASLPPGGFVAVAFAPGRRSLARVFPATAAPRPGAFVLHRDPPSDPALHRELQAMVAQDQRVRQAAAGGDPAAIAEARSVDAANQARLKEILRSGGWPRFDAVGAQGVRAAWLIVQHAPAPVLKRWLPALQAAADAGELSPADLAASIDRDRVHDGRPQLHGTQRRPSTNGAFAGLYPVEDEAHVDARRAAVGLDPLADFLAAARARQR